MPAVQSPEPRSPFCAGQGANAQEVPAVDGGTGAAPFVDGVDLVQPLFLKSGPFLLRRKQR